MKKNEKKLHTNEIAPAITVDKIEVLDYDKLNQETLDAIAEAHRLCMDDTPGYSSWEEMWKDLMDDD